MENKKIKVLHFIWSANFGGIEKMGIELVREQNRSAEVDASLLIGCNKGEFLELISQYKIPLLFGNLESGYDFSVFKLSKMIKMMKEFDIIHFHTFNIVVALAAIFSGKKIVYTIHGNFNYGKKVSTSVQISNSLKSIFLNRFVNSIIYNSAWCKSEAENKFGLKNKNGKIIYNGLPASENNAVNFDPIIDIPKGKFIVGTVSRFNKSKRIERLIEGFSSFAKNKSDVLLLMVGDGIERKNLEQLIEKSGISNVTIFTGYQSDPLPYLNAMNVCVFPFEKESFGLVMLESFGLGKPTIIFSDSGGMKEIQGENFKEDVVERAEQLTKRLEYYYKSPPLPDEIQQRKSIAATFSISEMSRKISDCYLEVMGN